MNTGTSFWVSELKLILVCSCALDGLRPPAPPRAATSSYVAVRAFSGKISARLATNGISWAQLAT